MESSNLYLFPSSSGKDKNKNVFQVRGVEGRASLKEPFLPATLPSHACALPLFSVPRTSMFDVLLELRSAISEGFCVTD